MINTHSVYGRVVVNPEDMHNGKDFIEVTLMNKRDGLPAKLTVGKCALSDKGDYVSKKDRKTSLIQDYLPLAYSAASKMYSEKAEWEELLQVAALGLTVAANRFDPSRNNGFAAYARPYIMGYIKQHLNPVRNGTMNTTISGFIPDGEDLTSNTPEENDMKLRLYGAIEMLTDKQKFVVEMVGLKGYTETEVAEMMGIAQKNVHVLLDRATVALRKHLKVDAG